MVQIGLNKLAVEVNPTYTYHTGLRSLNFLPVDAYHYGSYRPKSTLF